MQNISVFNEQAKDDINKATQGCCCCSCTQVAKYKAWMIDVRAHVYIAHIFATPQRIAMEHWIDEAS